MVRIDIWDVEKAEDQPPVNCGLPRFFEERCSHSLLLAPEPFGVFRD